MNVARLYEKPTARRPLPAGRLALFVLLACGAACCFAPNRSRADPLFGDSTWVAPAEMFDSLYTTNGPRVAHRDHERGWETALRMPFRVVFFPVRLMGSGLEAVASYAGPRYIAQGPKPPPKPGISIAPYVMVGTVNDLGLGGAITWVGFPVADARLRLAGAWTTQDHRRVQFSDVIGDRKPVEFSLLADYDYKANRRYFGIGNNTPETNLSYYLLVNTNVGAALALGASPLRQLHLAGGYSSITPGRGYNASPLLDDVFTPAEAPYAHLTTQEFWYGATGRFAALDDARDPSRGVDGRVDLRRVQGSRSIDPDYDQWRAEARTYVPVFATRRVIAIRAIYAGVNPTGNNASILPFYRLMQSDGDTHFAGYDGGRFHDQQLMLARVEYRWLIIHRVYALALYEWGAVSPNAASFTLRDTHKSYGGGLRIGVSDESAMRFELADSDEGLHAILALGGDF